MESPSKRLKTSVPDFQTQSDYISLSATNNQSLPDDRFQSTSNGLDGSHNRRPIQRSQHQQTKFDRLNAKDRPKSKHHLPENDPWILVKTRFGRCFIHNPETKQSLWKIPDDFQPGVRKLENEQALRKEKFENARWAEAQLQQSQQASHANVRSGDSESKEQHRSRRRRSESLQREDEEAMMAELAAQDAAAEEEDVKETVHNVEKPLQQQSEQAGYASDSSYEEVEVTDSEGEEDRTGTNAHEAMSDAHEEDVPMEFGEDDIAYQLAAMGEDYDLDPAEYGDTGAQGYDVDEESLGLSDEDAVLLFKDMLSDHGISPYTPWDQILSNESEGSILHDDRYTVLPSMKVRKEVFDSWVKETAAAITAQRLRTEQLDPRIPYLAFLQEKATPKLYWPEFKRKFKKEAAMNHRKLTDKDREKLYRDHINRLKLPESTRKADFINMLKEIPLKDLNHSSGIDALPQQMLCHLHYISLTPALRDDLLLGHIRILPPPPTKKEAELSTEEAVEREQRSKREIAMAERQRKVNEDKRKAEIEGRKARGRLQDGQRELEAAMNVRNSMRENP